MKWSDRHLHVVSFDIPYPPTYGGVIDVYYKLAALAKQGVRVHLHCFSYGRPRAAQLDRLCASVSYYPRNVSKSQLFHRRPYIVVSRSSDKLIDRLAADTHPVLFEGLHSCHALKDPRLENRIRIVRTHNIEHDYYRNLAKVEQNIFKRYYFYNEATKLEQFEATLADAGQIAAISPGDADWFRGRYGHTFYLPAFHANDTVTVPEATGHYAFYHGNLSVGENNAAARYLVTRVFTETDLPLVIAGQNPSRELRDLVAGNPKVSLVENPTGEKVRQLLAEAQVNVLPTFQPTGIKLKLLTALFNGRHCVVNPAMVEHTGLDTLCTVAQTEEEFRQAVAGLAGRAVTEAEAQVRRQVLDEKFSNDRNIVLLLERLFSDSGQG